MPIEVSDLAEIKRFIAEDKVTVVDFFATWCGPCKKVMPTFESLAEQYGSQANFLKVDIDEGEDIAEEFEVEAMPTFQFFKGGKLLEKFTGGNEEKLRETVNRLVSM